MSYRYYYNFLEYEVDYYHSKQGAANLTFTLQEKDSTFLQKLRLMLKTVVKIIRYFKIDRAPLIKLLKHRLKLIQIFVEKYYTKMKMCYTFYNFAVNNKHFII